MSNYIDNNPWAGLSSYEDPEKARREGRKPKLFCGRGDESHQVTQLICSNIFVTLYGKSGTGKTSLLNAGVFPRLRQKRYLPVSIRLSMDARDISFQQCIVHRLSQAITEHQGQLQTVEVVPMPADEKAPDYLWSHFARTRFVDGEGRTLFPVIVLDQFEEIFRNRRPEAEVLLRQIAYLTDESHALTSRMVEGQPYKYDFNFRFVASIREDDLYRLEDSIDNNYLSELKRCRYRLRSLTEQGAKDVILIPGGDLFEPEEQTAIADAIISKSRNEDDSISTNIISLLCSRIFVDFQKSDADHITPALVDNFIKGNPFERFYNEATRGFSNREKSYIEEHLVDSTGRRNSIPESDFLLHVPKGKDLLEGDTRILQRTSTSSDGSNYRIELIHDSFCEPLAGLKEKRERRKRLRKAGVAAIALICLGVMAYILYLLIVNYSQKELISYQGELLRHERDSIQRTNVRLKQVLYHLQVANAQKDSANEQLSQSFQLLSEREQQLSVANQGYQTNLSRVLAEKAKQLAGDHDSYLARLIALQALPPYRPYIVEAENALRTATIHDDAVLRGHTSSVKSASFSPDGKLIVSASYDNTVRIWDAQTGKGLQKLEGHTSDVNSASFSPDGKRIVSASRDGTIRIWDAQTGKEVQKLEGHTGSVNSASFSPDGKYIVSASQNNTVRIWDAQTGKELKKLEGHTASVYSASFSPDGKFIVSASYDNTVRIWDAQTGKELKKLEGHTNSVESASFSPDGKRIVSASWDKTIRIWDTQTGKELKKLEGHTSVVASASFSPDGKRIVSASRDNTVRIWDAQTGKELQKLEGHTESVYSASFNPDGKHIVSASWDKTVRIWDAQTGKELKKLEGHTESVMSASFSLDGKFIVSASLDNTVRIWDAQTGKELQKLEGHTSDVKSASFSPDGKRIVSASLDKTVRIWDAQTGKELKKLEGHTSGVNSASFSPDGKRIVSASYDKTVRIWDVQTGKELKKLEGHTGNVYSVSFSPDGKYIVSASWDQTVRIWDAQTGKELKKLEGHTNCVICASFSPDGKLIVSASWDKTIRIWDAQTGKELKKLEGHTGTVNYASFSPDGNRIVSASDDGTIRIWDFPSLEDLIDQTRERFKNRPLTPEERQKYYLE